MRGGIFGGTGACLHLCHRIGLHPFIAVCFNVFDYQPKNILSNENSTKYGDTFMVKSFA